VKISILGTEYEIDLVKNHNDKALDNSDGYCDSSVKQIVVDDMSESVGHVGVKKDLNQYRKKVVRHEVIHAFLYESGLAENSWGENEEIVDWIAVQFPKMLAAFREVDAL